MGSRTNYSQMPDFEGSIAANGNPYVWLDGGPTYEEFHLETDLATAEIEAFVIEKNGQERVRLSGQQLLDREAYDGRSATSGHFVFSFSDAVARSIQGEAMTSLVTQPGDRIKVSLELSSGVSGSETATLYALTTPNRRAEEFALFVTPEDVPVTKTGDNDFTGFRRGNVPWQGGRGAIAIRRVFAYGNVTHLRIEQDDRFPYGKNKLKKAVNDAMLKRNGKTVPTSSTCYTYDPIARGNAVLDLFDTFSTKSLRVTFTTGDSNDIEAITEYVERLENPPVAA